VENNSIDHISRVLNRLKPVLVGYFKFLMVARVVVCVTSV